MQGWPCAPAAGITWRIQLRSAFYALHYRATNRTKTIRAQHQLREQITATTNKVEAYNGFSKWLLFGGEGVIADNDPEEREKVIKYNDLVVNDVIFQICGGSDTYSANTEERGIPGKSGGRGNTQSIRHGSYQAFWRLHYRFKRHSRADRSDVAYINQPEFILCPIFTRMSVVPV